MRRRAIAIALSCALAASLAGGTAVAKEVTPYVYSGTSFDATGSTAGAFQTVGNIAVDQLTGHVYVIDRNKEMVTRFDAAGNPAPFSHPSLEGASSVPVPGLGEGSPYIAVDNSGNATQGRIVVVAASIIYGFDPSGQELGGRWPLCRSSAGTGAGSCGAQGVTIDSDAILWTSTPFPAFTQSPATLTAFDSDGGEQLNRQILKRDAGAVDVDAAGALYAVSDYKSLQRFVPDATLAAGSPVPTEFLSFPLGLRGQVAVNRSTGTVFASHSTRVGVYDPRGEQIDSLGEAEGTYEGLFKSDGVAINEATGDVYVGNARSETVDIFTLAAPVGVPNAETEAVTELTASSVTLHGTIDADGGADTTICRFEWGLTPALGSSVPCAEGVVHTSAEGAKAVSAHLSGVGLLRGRRYHYRLVAGNAGGPLQYGRNLIFQPSSPPAVTNVAAGDVTTDTVEVRATVEPRGGDTSYRVEIGKTTAYGDEFPKLGDPSVACYTVASRQPRPCPGRLKWATPLAAVDEAPVNVAVRISGLAPANTYHFRFVAENQAGETAGSDETFNTFAVAPVDDRCPNHLARQQTGAAQLLNCRAYELVSASDAAGYDVESDLVPGQQPFAGYPHADGKALYAVHDGGIPNTGKPTNRGPDPYVATRNPAAQRWETEYVGIPSDAPSAVPFSSTLAGADSGLTTFAFGGPEICAPCFADGSIDVPLRMPNGDMTQGMQGSLDPGLTDPAGEVRKPLSADGSHLVFGSDAKLEPDGNENGDATIYDRNLKTGTTQVVSRLSSGETMSGEGIAQLDISEDGARIVVGQRVSTDAAGNDYFHPYLHVGNSPSTIDLAPGTTSGVLYNGMTSDGSMVFFSSPDQLTADDTDSSMDVFRADVGEASAILTRVSTGVGGAGDTDACNPEPNSFHSRWNRLGSTPDCSAMPIAGGGGIARESGDVYFLSPEALDGEGKAGEPNLFVAKPGQLPSYVATLESRATGPKPTPTSHPFRHSFGGFSNPQSIAVHEATGDILVLDAGSGGSVRKFDAEGNPSDFSATPGSNALPGPWSFSSGLSQVAVDNSGGPTDGTIYVANTGAGNVRVFDAAGNSVGTLTGSATPFGGFFFTASVAVDPAGNLYVGALSGAVHRYVPSGGPATDADHDAALQLGPAFASAPTYIAADSTGAVYAHVFGGAPGVRKYAASQFGSAAPTGSTINSTSKTVGVDPVTDHAYASPGGELFEYLPTEALFNTFGSEDVSNVSGVAADGTSGNLYATDATNKQVVVFGTKLGADPRMDHPAVVHAVNAAERISTADFQVNPSGEVAVLPSTISLTGYDKAGPHRQVFRYDAITGSMGCVSCPRSNAPVVGEASLASDGLSVTDDGRVFFNSHDRLVLRDANRQLDVYEWSEQTGRAELVSTGLSPSGSSLLSASADGTDAFFFTRQKLVASDLNGSTVKIYTAREEGGFFVIPPPPLCQASDECHGPSSQAAPPPPIASRSGTGGQRVRISPRCNPRRFARRAARGPARRARALRRRARGASGQRARRLRAKARKAARTAAKRRQAAARKCRRANRTRATRGAGK